MKGNVRRKKGSNNKGERRTLKTTQKHKLSRKEKDKEDKKKATKKQILSVRISTDKRERTWPNV